MNIEHQYMAMGENLERDIPEWMVDLRTDIEAELQSHGLEVTRMEVRAKTEPTFDYVSEKIEGPQGVYVQQISANWKYTGEVNYNINVDHVFFLTSQFKEHDNYKKMLWTVSLHTPFIKHMKETLEFDGVIKWMLKNRTIK